MKQIISTLVLAIALSMSAHAQQSFSLQNTTGCNLHFYVIANDLNCTQSDQTVPYHISAGQTFTFNDIPDASWVNNQAQSGWIWQIVLVKSDCAAYTSYGTGGCSNSAAVNAMIVDEGTCTGNPAPKSCVDFDACTQCDRAYMDILSGGPGAPSFDVSIYP